MNFRNLHNGMLVLTFSLLSGLTVMAQQTQNQPNDSQPKDNESAKQAQVAAGQKQKINGVVVLQQGENLVVRSQEGADYNIQLKNNTKIKEEKSNPFRSAKKYSNADLKRGLSVEVEGRGDSAGALVAEKIQFTQDELRTANSIVSLVVPVEGRVTSAEERLTMSEQNAKRLSGQLDELAAVANAANGGAKAAQDTADKALLAANSANERITTVSESLNNRVTMLDEYDVSQTISINFRVGSATLSTDAKAVLDEIAAQTKNEKGYVIQVAGFASSDGNEAFNRRLSQRRAEAVMSYLIENHDISQRRIITPLGFGEARPAADNDTLEGRKENRRVEVAILVNKGLLPATSPTSSSLNQPPQY